MLLEISLGQFMSRGGIEVSYYSSYSIEGDCWLFASQYSWTVLVDTQPEPHLNFFLFLFILRHARAASFIRDVQ